MGNAHQTDSLDCIALAGLALCIHRLAEGRLVEGVLGAVVVVVVRRHMVDTDPEVDIDPEVGIDHEVGTGLEVDIDLEVGIHSHLVAVGNPVDQIVVVVDPHIAHHIAVVVVGLHIAVEVLRIAEGVVRHMKVVDHHRVAGDDHIAVLGAEAGYHLEPLLRLYRHMTCQWRPSSTCNTIHIHNLVYFNGKNT